MTDFDKDILFQFYTREYEMWEIKCKWKILAIIMAILAVVIPHTEQGGKIINKIKRWADSQEWYMKISQPEIKIEIKIQELSYFTDRFPGDIAQKPEKQVIEKSINDENIVEVNSYSIYTLKPVQNQQIQENQNKLTDNQDRIEVKTGLSICPNGYVMESRDGKIWMMVECR